MSELIMNNDNRATIRWKLLTGASALALASYISSADMARAGDSGRPLIWLDVDSQFALQKVDTEAFLPAFLYASPFNVASKGVPKQAPSVWDESAKISFQPSDSNWFMSLGVRYGKSSRRKAGYQYEAHPTVYHYKYKTAYQGVHANTDEKHVFVDFKAGKDFGLGMFGHGGNSIVSIGVRFAQFDSRNNSSVASRPSYSKYNFYRFHDSFEATRSFRGVGPSLSWDASASLAGNPSDASLTADWGINCALLFGRQQMKGHHQKTAQYQAGSTNYGTLSTVYHTSKSPARSKNVTVPNLGAYAALSLRYTDLKVSIGYRADMFFGAIDGGIDKAKKEDRGFYGPFASISIGVGD